MSLGVLVVEGTLKGSRMLAVQQHGINGQEELLGGGSRFSPIVGVLAGGGRIGYAVDNGRGGAAATCGPSSGMIAGCCGVIVHHWTFGPIPMRQFS